VAAALAAAPGARAPAPGAPGAPSALAPRVSLTVSAAALRALGAARGWRATPAGNASFAWAADAPRRALAVALTAPAGAETALELPLAAVRGAARARVTIDGGAAVFDLAGGAVAAARGASAAAWAPAVLRCGAGAAAARVDGRAPRAAPPPGGACEDVILFALVPAGDHEVVLEGADA
jgi:hypothetical protein